MMRTMRSIPSRPSFPPKKASRTTNNRRAIERTTLGSSSTTAHSPTAELNVASSSSVDEEGQLGRSPSHGYHSTNQHTTDYSSLPSWLMKTFKTLVNNHPLRLLLPHASSEERTVEQTQHVSEGRPRDHPTARSKTVAHNGRGAGAWAAIVA